MPPYRLGFPVKLLGAPLRSHDSRRWQNRPHLSVSLLYLRDIFEYLHSRQITFYRLSGQLAPYVTHPGLPQFHDQLSACATELAIAGDHARACGLRLTLHPAHFVQLSSPDESVARRARTELSSATDLLDAMGLDDDAVVVTHVGGVYGDAVGGCERFVRRYHELPERVRRRLVMENDDRRYSFEQTLWIHRRTGIPLVLDTLHLHCLNPARRTLADALETALNTWPPDRRPKIHVSSPRTAVRPVRREAVLHPQAPLPNQHSDFIDPFAFIDLVRTAQDRQLRPFDMMLEAKAKDLALIRLREQVAQFTPELVPLLG